MANNFVHEYDDHRAISGIGGALYFKKPSDTKYAFAFATENIPSVRGDVESYEFSIITSPFKGQTEGQMTLDKKDVPVLWHRDMISRLKEIAGMGELDFLAVAQDYSADQFTGTLQFKRDDISGDTLKGTVTIIPSAATTDYILDCRSMLMLTAKFKSIIPDRVKLPTTATPETISVVADGTDVIGATPTITDGATGAASTKITAAWANGTLTLTNANSGGTAVTEYVVVTLTVSGVSEGSKQDWKASIAVEVPPIVT